MTKIFQCSLDTFPKIIVEAETCDEAWSMVRKAEGAKIKTSKYDKSPGDDFKGAGYSGTEYKVTGKKTILFPPELKKNWDDLNLP